MKYLLLTEIGKRGNMNSNRNVSVSEKQKSHSLYLQAEGGEYATCYI